MDFDRDWTPFALDAEVDHYGTRRIAEAHNRLRREIAALRSDSPRYPGESDEAYAFRVSIEQLCAVYGIDEAELQRRLARPASTGGERDELEQDYRCPDCGEVLFGLPVDDAIEVEIKRRTEPAFVRPKFVYEISAPTVLGGTLDDGSYVLLPRQVEGDD